MGGEMCVDDVLCLLVICDAGPLLQRQCGNRESARHLLCPPFVYMPPG
jgi:hypothetical protein